MNALLSLYTATAKEFLRDRLALFWTVGFPIFLMLIFGIVFSGDGDIAYAVGIANQDDGPLGKALVEIFEEVEAFETSTGERDELVSQLEEGDLRIVIVIPKDFTLLAAITAVEVEVVYDPTNQTSAQIVLSIVNQILEGFEREVTVRPSLLKVTTTPITSDRLGQIDFIVPGIIAMAFMQLGLFGTAPQLVQLREQQVLRRLGATPLPRTTLLASQILWRLTLILIQIVTLIVVGRLVFDITILGSYWALFGLSMLGGMVFIALGFMIAAFSKTQDSVNGITSFLNFPMMFLSGIFFPVEIMPDWIRPVVAAIPVTYIVDSLRQVMLESPPLYSMATDLIVMASWLVVSTVLAIRFFKWE